jgi:voltage-gated potassium channel
VVGAAASLAAVGCAAAPPGPRTALGRALAVTLVVLAGGLVVGPVGIVVAEVRRAARAARACARCTAEAHDADADYCHRCGARRANRSRVTGASEEWA